MTAGYTNCRTLIALRGFEHLINPVRLRVANGLCTLEKRTGLSKCSPASIYIDQPLRVRAYGHAKEMQVSLSDMQPVLSRCNQSGAVTTQWDHAFDLVECDALDRLNALPHVHRRFGRKQIAFCQEVERFADLVYDLCGDIKPSRYSARNQPRYDEILAPFPSPIRQHRPNSRYRCGSRSRRNGPIYYNARRIDIHPRRGINSPCRRRYRARSHIRRMVIALFRVCGSAQKRSGADASDSGQLNELPHYELTNHATPEVLGGDRSTAVRPPPIDAYYACGDDPISAHDCKKWI